LKHLPAADHVAHTLLRVARNPDRRELTGAIEPRQVGRVARVVLALHARAFGNEGRRDDVAGIPPLLQRAVEHVARSARFVARPDVCIAPHPIEPFLQFGEIVGQLVEPGRHLGALGQDRDGDRVLVHIHAEIDDWASSGSNTF
jgi:hypothetical protein